MEKFNGIRALAKAIGVRFVLGLFFVSSLILMFVAEMVNRQINRHGEMITELTQTHLMITAQALAKFVSAEELDRYHTDADTDNPDYENLKQRLEKFAEENNLKYAYYWRAYNDDQFQYIVDNDREPDTWAGPGPKFGKYIENMADEERDALTGHIGATDLGTYTNNTWKGLLTAYAPVYDKDGNFYCVAGVDISDAFIIAKKEEAEKMTIIQLIALPLSIFFGILNMLLYRKKAQQIEEAHVKLQYFNNNLRRAFSTYLSEDVVEEIVSDPTRLQLGGVKRHMTALFTDVKGFTRIAEALSPEHLVDLLNYYLSTMSDIILEQKGTIDKYEGDAIMAFFGAPIDLPDHQLRACIAAIFMKRLEKEANKYILEKEISPSPLLTRIGINTGDMVVGNMGTQKKMNYTIISNAVNMASRLEGVNKQYGTWILASEEVIKETKNMLLTRKLDRIRVVGIKEPVRIYEILETTEDAPQALHDQVQLFHQGLKLFEERNWVDAEKVFSKILTTSPKDGPSQLFLNRCRKYRDYPPESTWDGVLNLTQK